MNSQKPVRGGLSAEATNLHFVDWGLMAYQEALNRQLELVDMVHQELARDTVVFCTHPPVVTLGRGTLEGDVFGWIGEVVEVNRGGRATYHGPNQVVVYPILDLNQRDRRRDLHRYLCSLESCLVKTLADFGIEATGRSIQAPEGEEAAEATGAWIGQRKIASIGIGVRKWITFHGLALNVDDDPTAFQGLKPCGFSAQTMTSMQEALGRKIVHAEVKAVLEKHLAAVL